MGRIFKGDSPLTETEYFTGSECILREAKWKDYELIDTSDGERLERWGNIILIRPDPQII